MKAPTLPETKQSLSAAVWAEAALEAIAQGGLDAVAVEPLARQLGVTKGSFYWHFPNRDALLRAALELWEKHHADELLARVDPQSDPWERIVSLFKAANMSVREGRLYLAIAAATDNPVVQQFVQRLSQRWISYLHECYQALGFKEPDARHWALFAFATFMGNLQIRRDTPEMIPEGQAFSDYVKLMIRTLIPREGREWTASDRPAAPTVPPELRAEAAASAHVVPIRRGQG